ncbi:MAG: uracil phosphoribosyltransferase [Candidatus Calescibacterium sp.]|nr:uracil phosphoribosyltransferase [Candidatus Calescibacterium sp.]MDW8133223.1 uracil phosphoribosyltransferase [Candidatus Calescibacterium sp.]
MIIPINHPIAQIKLSILRNKDTTPDLFRKSLEELSYLFVFYCFEKSEMDPITIYTPLEEATGHKLKEKHIVIPILRAGLGLLPAFTKLIPDIVVGIIGLSRDENTLKPTQYYANLPANLEDFVGIILEPMIATGGSINKAIEILLERKIHKIKVCSIIAFEKSIIELNENYPFVEFFVLSIDKTLNSKGYIVPGLGDAGDRTFGTLINSQIDIKK